MHKCNISDKASKQESKPRPVICNGAINAKSPQVQTHFQRLKLSVRIPRAWSQIKTHDQLHILLWEEGMWELWCGCRIHTAQSHVRLPVYFASGFTCNTCSVVRGFLCITSLEQMTSWTCTANSKGLATFARHFFELISTEGWAVEHPPTKVIENRLWYLLKTCVSAGSLLLQEGITADNAQNFDQTLLLCSNTLTPIVLCSSSGWAASASITVAWLW